MSESIIVALITAGFAFLGNYISNRKNASLVEYRLKELEDAMKKHNNLIERTFHLEERMSVVEERQRVANNRIDDLERRE